MDVYHHSRAILLGVYCTFVGGCASRSVPPRYPETAAASPQAQAAPEALVTRALDGDPPLPDQETRGWPGLARKSGKPNGMHGAHHHEH